MREDCVARQIPPPLQPGECQEDGRFFRNLKQKHVSKRYERDHDENPEFGHKLARKFWKDADKEHAYMSVNECDCTGSEECSVALHPNGAQYYHVATIDLAAINRSGVLSSPLVAQYKPLAHPDPVNACHFELMPRDSTTFGWLEVQDFFDNPFPEGKLPNSEEERKIAHEAYREFSACFQVRRWISA